MECVQTKGAPRLDGYSLAARAAACRGVWVDLGTGDGRFVCRMAAAYPDWMLVGVDACREQIRLRRRDERPNQLFVIANALALPAELDGLALRVSVNFPWGSLLAGLLAGDPRLLAGLGRIARPEALLELRLNADALAGHGLTLAAGAARAAAALGRAGWRVGAPAALGPGWLGDFPSTWARRLAHGRDPRAAELRAVRL